MWSVNIPSKGWMPLVFEESDRIERAFNKGNASVTIFDKEYVFCSMLQITYTANDTLERQLLRTEDTTNWSPAWLCEQHELNCYEQMKSHYTGVLTVMRQRDPFQTFCIHDMDTFITYTFDLRLLKYTNTQTVVTRNIIPPLSCPQPAAIELKEGALVPNEFKCPMTLELMVDPVLASDGNTYERYTFERWISGGNAVSPLTNLPLSFIFTTPNLNLKSLIAKFAIENAPENAPVKENLSRKRKRSRYGRSGRC